MFNLGCPCGLPLPLGSSRGWELLATVAMGVSAMVTSHPSLFCLLSRGLMCLWGRKQLHFQRTSSRVYLGCWDHPWGPPDLQSGAGPGAWSFLDLPDGDTEAILSAEELLDSKPGSPELGASRVCTE